MKIWGCQKNRGILSSLEYACMILSASAVIESQRNSVVGQCVFTCMVIVLQIWVCRGWQTGKLNRRDLS